MKLVLNREYAARHLFVVVLMLGLSGWFGFDGFVRYPSMSARDLYVMIEKAEPDSTVDLPAFGRQKIRAQYGMALATLAFALIVGLRLLLAARLRFSFDETGFVWDGRAYGWKDVSRIDDSRWERKRITRLHLKDSRSVTLDAWHHLGVREFRVWLGEHRGEDAK